MSGEESTPGASPVAGADLPAALQERRSHALRDLEELSEQVAIGELDEATAAELRAGYEAELAAVEREATQPEVAAPADPGGRSSRRALIGALLLIGAFTVVIIVAAQVFRSDGGSSSQAEPDTGGMDAAALAELEEVVAAHPDVPGMRLALADLYFEQGDYGSAVDHYLTVLSGKMTVEEESHTLGRIGWMAYSTGQVGAAVDYLNASLTADPNYSEGKLFLGMVRLYGLEDAAGAIPLLEEVLALPDLTSDVRSQVEMAVNDARSVLGTP